MQGINYNWFGEGILFADDDIYSHMLLEKIFQRTGAKLFHAHNGHEAIDIMKKSGHEINVAIIDIIMPGLNGYEVAYLIDKNFPDVSLIAYTADTVSLDIEKCRQCGFIKLLTKPTLPNRILSEINNLMTVKNKL
ncbi:MAG: response regulator [Bacteroidales bacterium]|nr:response regulator [Bacteroidales bacterium]